MRFLLSFWFMISFMANSVLASEVTTVTLVTPRGAEVEVLITYPDVPAGTKVPAIIAAPGRNYHARLPIFSQLRDQGAAAGMAIFTFNWNFYSKGTKPEAPFKNEVEDMQAVLNLAKEDPRVDAAKIIIEGKSLGTLVAHNIFQNNPDAFGLHLWTPLCETKEDLNENYPGLAALTKPVAIVSGTADEACSPKVMHEALANAGSNIAYVMVPGDHGFMFGEGDDPALIRRGEQNVSAVIAIAVQWAKAAFGI